MRLSLRSKAILALGVLITFMSWDVAFSFGNFVTESVLNQTINFVALVILIMVFARLIRTLLKGTKLAHLTFVIEFYFIAHGFLYIHNFIKYRDNWDGWAENFYEYAIFIPAIMVFLTLLSIVGNIIIKNMGQ